MSLSSIGARGRELLKTIGSLFQAGYDWSLLNIPFLSRLYAGADFAFLVHPRTDNFTSADVYGQNDIYRPYPAFRWLFNFLPKTTAERIVLWYARVVHPITLSRITVKTRGPLRKGRRHLHGYLLSIVRTPRQMAEDPSGTRARIKEMFTLAGRKMVTRVGLGALLPSMTGYGEKLKNGNAQRPRLSTGHGYTAYVIVDYLRMLVSARNPDANVVSVAILGAGGSTGIGVLRMLKRRWDGKQKLNLLLLDLPQKQERLGKLAGEVHLLAPFAAVKTSSDHALLRDYDYVVVVTNSRQLILKAGSVRPGTVIIDDSQPRNTSPELVSEGCIVLDVLARVNGLNCGFDFGFKAEPSVTFTCLAETILAAAAGHPGDLAVGEVTDVTVEKTVMLAKWGEAMELIGALPLVSFGQPLQEIEIRTLLTPALNLASGLGD